MLTKEYDRIDEAVEISETVRLHYFNEDKFNTNVISVVWTIPAERDTATKMALLSEALRLGPGGNRTALEERLADMYGAVFESVIVQKGGRQLLALNMECVSDEAAGEKVMKNAAALMKEIIETKITETALKQAKNRLRTDLTLKRDSPAAYAVESLIDIVYPDDGFSVHCDGYIEDIDSVSTRDLNELFNALKEYSHTDIFISGNMDEKAAFEIASGFVGRRGDIEKLPIDEVTEAGGCALKGETRSIGQSRIAIAYTTELNAWGKDWCIALVLRELLCGAGSSLLYDKVRQDEGLCYYIGGRLMRFRMVYVIDAGVEAGSEEKTIKLIDDAVKSFTVEEDRLEAAKRAVLRELKSKEDRRLGIINERMNEMLLGITIDHDAKKNIKSIKAEDVAEAAKNLCRKGVFTLSAAEK
ncbi:MAG: insulinase family protein [Clostridiales bacterium]|nr:insulinase family protein [Clostridiales bacterium]